MQSQNFRNLRMGKVAHKVMMAAEKEGDSRLINQIFLAVVQVSFHPSLTPKLVHVEAC